MRAVNLIDQTTKIVVAYVSHNTIPVNKIASLIRCVHDVLVDIDIKINTGGIFIEIKNHKEILASQKYDWLISFIDGQPYKTLKRHLNAHGLTPDIYRTRYGLPADYPMVSPAYAARRSQIAKGLYSKDKES